MPHNPRSLKDLRDDEAGPLSPGGEDGEVSPPPFTFTPLGVDPALGWSGWGVGTMAGWTRAQAELQVRGEGEEMDRPRREPRER
jgi:hypothetical protein